jgi:hypothetical protein
MAGQRSCGRNHHRAQALALPLLARGIPIIGV